MQSPFHEHKLWQSSFVALMEVHDLFDPLKGGENDEIVRQVLDSATELSAKIADGLSRLDKRFGRQVLMDAIGMVAVVRTNLAVSWGRGLLPDETFRQIDTKYNDLAIALQNYR
jgi:four helix bundle protein